MGTFFRGADFGFAVRCFFDRSVESARVDAFGSRERAAASDLVVVDNAGEAGNEELLDRNREGFRELVEHVDGRICCAALDVRDGLSGDAGGECELGLGEPSLRASDDEVRTDFLAC